MKKSIILTLALAFGAFLFSSFTTVENNTCDEVKIETVVNLEAVAAPQCYTQADLEAFLDCYGISPVSSECKVWDLNQDYAINTSDLLILLARMCP